MGSIALDRADAPAADLPRAGAASPPSTNWRMVAVLTMIFSLSSIDRGIIPLLVEPIRADLGLSDVQMSLLLGLSFVLLFSLCALPAGYLAAILIRPLLLAISTVFWSIMVILSGLAQRTGRASCRERV